MDFKRGIPFAWTNMLPTYLKVLKARASQALNMRDWFDIILKFSEAIDIGWDKGRQVSA